MGRLLNFLLKSSTRTNNIQINRSKYIYKPGLRTGQSSVSESQGSYFKNLVAWLLVIPSTISVFLLLKNQVDKERRENLKILQQERRRAITEDLNLES